MLRYVVLALAAVLLFVTVILVRDLNNTQSQLNGLRSEDVILCHDPATPHDVRILTCLEAAATR